MRAHRRPPCARRSRAGRRRIDVGRADRPGPRGRSGSRARSPCRTSSSAMWPYSACEVFTARHRLERVDVAEPPLGDDRGRAVPRGDVDDRTVIGVGDVVPLGHVDAVDHRERGEEAGAVAVAGAIGGDHFDDQLLAFADRHEVHERRDRLRIREGARRRPSAPADRAAVARPPGAGCPPSRAAAAR